jgi:hypothetical protein
MDSLLSIFVSRTSEIDCQGWGNTIWEQCFWINNVKWVSGTTFLAVWFGPLYLVYRKFPDSLVGSLVGLMWLFFGGVVAVVVSFMFVHPLLLSIVDG